MRTDGFFTNIYSSNKFDVISFKCLLDRFDDKCRIGCGLHFEIYHIKMLGELRDYMDQLRESEWPSFFYYAGEAGFHIDDENYKHAVNAYRECLAEINSDV